MDDFPPRQFNPWDGDFAAPAVLGAAGIIWLGDIPLPQARELVAGGGWTVYGEPLPAEPPPEPLPQLEPPPPNTPFPPAEPGNDPFIEPRTPVTPQPLPPAGEPTIPPAPILEDDIPRGGRPGGAPGEPPFELPPIVGIGLGEIVVGIGGLLWPTDTAGPAIDSGFGVPPVDIPAPHIDFPDLPPEFGAPPLADQEFPFPAPPDVVVVEAPRPQPVSRSQTPWPLTNIGSIQWPIISPRISPRPRVQPLPRAYAPPEIAPPPLPSSPPVPGAPPVPVSPPPPVPGTPPPPSLRAPPSAPALPQPLTPMQAGPVESAQQCETPDQTRERRKAQRESCRKLVRIKVKAHFRKVCLSEAIEHEAKRYRKKLVRKYITKPAGQLGKDATDWLLKKTGLTPYADQAKDVKKRVTDLTKRQKRYRIEIPGTHIDLDPVDLIPKFPKP